jgi:nucleotide-binding universal stress UspA family protein
MPEKKHLRGVSEKEQRQYEHIKEEAKKKAVIAGARRSRCAHRIEGAQGEGAQQRSLGMKKIVVGYDGSDAAKRALGRAADIAHAFSARLFVVSVSGLATVPVPVSTFEPAAAPVSPAVPGPVAAGGTVPLPEPVTPGEPEELARRRLERARGSLASRKVETEYLVELGDPAERLLEVAEQRDADLIVVGSREHGFLERLLARPINEAVARRAERDVLLVD